MSKDEKAVKTTKGAISAASKSLIPADYPGWLAADLRDVFPEMKGFPSSNLKYMRFFAQMCPDLRIGQQAADQFYHSRLKCYVVVELKATAFKPDHAGQFNFYLSAVDAQSKAHCIEP